MRAWEQHERFTLYEDALPVLAALREHRGQDRLRLERQPRPGGVRLPPRPRRRLRDRLSRFGRTKPHPEIFRHALALLGVEPEEAAMIGDSYEDDIEGARALGMKAFLLDRDGRRPDEPDRLPDLFSLPAALGLLPR